MKTDYVLLDGLLLFLHYWRWSDLLLHQKQVLFVEKYFCQLHTHCDEAGNYTTFWENRLHLTCHIFITYYRHFCGILFHHSSAFHPDITAVVVNFAMRKPEAYFSHFSSVLF